MKWIREVKTSSVLMTGLIPVLCTNAPAHHHHHCYCPRQGEQWWCNSSRVSSAPCLWFGALASTMLHGCRRSLFRWRFFLAFVSAFRQRESPNRTTATTVNLTFTPVLSTVNSPRRRINIFEILLVQVHRFIFMFNRWIWRFKSNIQRICVSDRTLSIREKKVKNYDNNVVIWQEKHQVILDFKKQTV